MDLPKEFISRTREFLGEEDLNKLVEVLDTTSPTSIRTNPFKWNNTVDEEPVSWCQNAYYLAERKPFTFDPLFHAGAYYVQEASSMFLDRVIKEYVKDRSQILAENIIKWGNSDIIVTNNSPADYSQFNNLFEFILTDVPCSGEGMFRKDEMAISEWSIDNVLNCQQRQREILKDIWSTLKEGGILVYSTCTYNREENEDNVKWISEELGAKVISVPISEDWKITGSLTDEELPVYRFLPHKTKGEGLFMAVLKKSCRNESEENGHSYLDEKRDKKNKKSNKGNSKTFAVPQSVKEWLNESDYFTFGSNETTIEAFPKRHYEIYDRVKDKLRIIHKGIEIASIKGKDLIPSH